MAAEVVHDDNVTGAEDGDQELFDVSAEAGAVDRPVDDAGGGDPVAAQCRQKGQCSPAAVAAAWRSDGCHAASAHGGGSYWSWPRVSSMNTRRLGSSRPWYCCHRTRRRAMSARSCSLAYRLFFKTDPFALEEPP